jgi:hypothetical protein
MERQIMRDIACAVVIFSSCISSLEAKRVDFWDEDIRILNVITDDRPDGISLVERRAKYQLRSEDVSLDYTDKRVGDYSLRVDSVDETVTAIELTRDLYEGVWDLSGFETMSLWGKTNDNSELWSIVLFDNKGHSATFDGMTISPLWTEVTISLNAFDVNARFDFSQVTKIDLVGRLNPDSKLWLDGIGFFSQDETLYVTDKSLNQRIADARESKAARVTNAFERQAGILQNDDIENLRWCNNCEEIIAAFSLMYLGEDLDKANAILTQELNKSSKRDTWSLVHTPLYIRFYYLFSNRVGQFPNRMTRENEEILLEKLWTRTVVKNDIALSRQSTWWMAGSENHDLNAKASSLITARIFMNEAKYKDRVYPNHGYGGGYHYGRAGYQGTGKENDTLKRHAGGRAQLSDDKSYLPMDHYEAWVNFFKKYIKERVQRGFLLEYGSPNYSQVTLNFIDLVYQYSGDAELKKMTGDFLTLFWADFAQVSNAGVRGGPKTRHHGNVGGLKDLSTASLLAFKLGGQGHAFINSYWNLINDFELPPIIWEMLLDREGMGTFTYKARGIGEEENEWPRPLGNERTMLVDTQSRFLKSTKVTPHYTIGTQMDHPAAVHSHLSMTGRWHGMTFSQSPDARVVPVGVPHRTNARGQTADYDTEIMLQTLHDEDVLIMQRARRWFAVHPEWYPAPTDIAEKPIAIWLGDQWEEKVEKDGWVFLKQGLAYAAIRIVFWDKEYEKENQIPNVGNQIFFHRYDDPAYVKLCEKCYSWSDDNLMMKLDNSDAAFVIQAGSQDKDSNFNSFIQKVIANPPKQHKTVVPGFHTLIYTGIHPSAKELVFNAGAPQIPYIDGQAVNYSYPMTFDSPYISSKYLSGKVLLRKGDKELTIDYSK